MTFVLDPDLLGLQDEVALVTGGGGAGMGRAHCIQLARAGCHIVVVDRDTAGGRETVEEVERLGREAIFVQADVKKPEDVARMVQTATDRFGKLDVAVNNAGGANKDIPFLDYTLESWNRIISLNLTATALCCQAEALAMIKLQIPGRIINVASSSGVVGAANISAYGAAKAGVINLTKSLSLELVRYGIRVNCIVPGVHTNPHQQALMDDPVTGPTFVEFFDRARKAPPLGRLGDPMETAGLSVFFASKLSGYVTGQSLLSDGGITLTTKLPDRGLDMEAEAVRRLGG